MIKVYKNWKLFEKFKWLDIKDNNDISYIYWLLVCYTNVTSMNIEIPTLCDSPMQYIMRKYWFTLESF
jgi:hypothetical protein